MKVKVYKADGKATRRSVTLDESVFGIDPSDHAIWLDVRSIQANGRQGTHVITSYSIHYTKLYDQGGPLRALHHRPEGRVTGSGKLGAAKGTPAPDLVLPPDG